MSIFLNGFKLELSSSTFTTYVQKMPSSQNLRSLKEKHENDWFLYWHEGLVYAIPKVPNPKAGISETFELKELKVDQNLKLLVNRINSLLPKVFYKYSPLYLN